MVTFFEYSLQISNYYEVVRLWCEKINDRMDCNVICYISIYDGIQMNRIRHHELTDLDTLLWQISTRSIVGINKNKPIADGFHSAIHSYDPSRAFGRYVKIICYGSRRNLQDILWSRFVQKYFAKRR